MLQSEPPNFYVGFLRGRRANQDKVTLRWFDLLLCRMEVPHDDMLGWYLMHQCKKTSRDYAR